MTQASSDAGFDEVLDRFEQAWRESTPPALDDFIKSIPPPRRELLIELVKIDLGHRWRCKPRDCNALALEDYVKQFPELGPLNQLPADLIGEEYWARQRWGDRPRHDEYLSRFLHEPTRLRETLARIDRDLAGEFQAKPISARPASEPALSVPMLLQTLRSLLSPGQMEQLERRGPFADGRALARELLARNWLTAYQVNQLLLGRGEQLVLGPYLLLERLGEGGAGQVFKARDRKANRLVAIKIIRKELLRDPDVIGRFSREFEVLSHLDHPNIVRGLDSGLGDGLHYLAMEFVEGTDLGRLVKQGGPMPVAQACEYIRQAACGLAHSHEKGLVHRDIKPHNLIMSLGDGLVKVADLGLARLPRGMNPELTELAARTTGTLTPEDATMMGTADYMAPEQALDFHAADIRADIYSLGCTFYFLLTGQPPFPGGNLAQKVARHLQGDLPAVEQYRKDLPAGLSAVLRKMSARRPEDRYQTPSEVATALAPFAAGSAPRSRWRQRLRRIIASRPRTAIAIGVVAVIGLLLLIALQFREGTFAPKQVDQFSVKKQDYLHTVAFSRDGRLMASGGGDCIVTFYDPAPGKQLDRKLFALTGHKAGISHLAFSPDGRLLVSGSVDGKTWKLWDIKQQRELASSAVEPVSHFHASRPFVGPFSPDGKTFAVCHGESTVSLMESSGKEFARFVLKELPTALAFHPNGKSVVFSAANKLVVHEIATGKETAWAPADGYIWALAYSPDGTMLAAAKNSGEVHLLDAVLLTARWKDKINLPRLLPSRTPIPSILFSPDGKMLACCGWDHQVKLWEPATGAELATLPVTADYTKPCWPLGFSANGNMLIVGGDDDTVRVWRLRW